MLGIFGMNILVPGQAEDGKTEFDPFIVLMVIMLVISTLYLIYFYYYCSFIANMNL